ncbi:uncharacterized protein RJT20DRAFT_131402 [Scheffersomyces xylosifermentans]|uniref:uncharacterized protein n=1 Tax=Scheffersomyces xylosifermentans TaxID=1304137 RepID=UPI00315CB358
MRLTDESKQFHHGVYAVVSQIPFGKVTSYGHIAYLLGKPQNSRQVGSSLKHCNAIIESLRTELQETQADDLSTFPYLDYKTLPWWRVISSAGKISPRENSNGEYIQSIKLREEGVPVSDGHMVDLDEFGWFPDDIDY